MKGLKTIFFHLVIDIREDDNSEINIWEASEKHEGPVLSAMDSRLNVNLALLIELITKLTTVEFKSWLLSVSTLSEVEIPPITLKKTSNTSF